MAQFPTYNPQNKQHVWMQNFDSIFEIKYLPGFKKLQFHSKITSNVFLKSQDYTPETVNPASSVKVSASSPVTSVKITDYI